MRFTAFPPFEIHPDQDGTHCIHPETGVGVSVLPNLGEVKVNHKVGVNQHSGDTSRWLHVDLKEKGVHIYVHGEHVVVSGRALNPTFNE